MLKLNRLFSTVTAKAFHDAIAPTERQRTVLQDAKNTIREFLRAEIHAATTTVLGLKTPVTPRFRTQGSWIYGTCVQPAWPGQQQIDLDFGVYLPVTVWESNGPPHATARLYFDLVEKRLGRLCEKRGWRLLPGKNTCIRVEVDSIAHIDIPLYAAPEREFVLIQERLVKAARTRDGMVMALDSAEEQVWEDLQHIVLATRTGEWKASDPAQISRWFRDRCNEHNDQLQRTCMYLKAWRDYHWPSGDGPTSVCIMVAAGSDFDCRHGRDDLVLERSAEILSHALQSDVRCDGIDRGKEDFNERMNAEQRITASAKAAELAASLKRARHLATGIASAQEAIRIVTAQLGDRVPQDASQIDSEGGEDIRAITATRVPPPVVKSTKAG